jgi:hypothetical protein
MKLKWFGVLAAAGALAAIGAVPASAAVVARYASPAGTGTDCSKAAPCSLETAVESAPTTIGLEVFVAPGTYVTGDTITATEPIHVIGAGSSRTRIETSAPVGIHLSNPGATVSDLGVDHTGTDSGILVLGADGPVIERVIATSHADGSAACSLERDATLRDSICTHDSTEASYSLRARAVAGQANAITINNVTAKTTWGAGLDARAAGAGAELTVTVRNSILRGAPTDVYSATSAGANASYVSTDFSNHGAAAIGGAGVVSAGLNNSGSDPLFLGPTDFHLTASSPAIDSGWRDYASALDVDGEPRNIGSVDMGADEFHPVPVPTGGPAPVPHVVPPAKKCGKKKKLKKGKCVKKKKGKKGKKGKK